MNFRTCTLMPHIEHNTSSASLILRPEDKSSSDGKPFLRVVPTRGWQSRTGHLRRVLCWHEEDVFGMRYLGKFALLLLVVEENREEQVLSAKSSDNNEPGAFFCGNKGALREERGSGCVDMCQDARSLCMNWASSREVFAGLCLSFLPLKKKRGSGLVPLPISLSYTHCGTGTGHLFRLGCPKIFISFTSRVMGLSADTIKLQVL